MMNKDDFYLKDVELCRALEPIMKKKGIQEDNGIIHSECGKTWLTADCAPCHDDVVYPTWRKDSLEAALPEWAWQYLPKEIFGTSGKKFNGVSWSDRFVDLKAEAICGDAKGQKCLKALAELIILLDKEGI